MQTSHCQAPCGNRPRHRHSILATHVARRSVHFLRCSASPPEHPDPSAANTSANPSPSLLDPVETIYWGGTLPNTRRAALGGLTGVAIALGGNLGGVTSWLLGLDGGRVAEQLRADVLVPVGGARRCVDYNYGFEFTYPAAWLGDQTLVYRAAQRAEAERGGPPGSRGADLEAFDFGSGRAAAARRQRATAVVEPVAAFGPAGTTGEENVSIIVAPIAPGFSLEALGNPVAAGERFLTMLAPEASGLQSTLLGAQGRTSTTTVRAGGRQAQQQQLYYTLEYTVQGPRFFRHNVSVYTTRNDLLYTFNAQCPETRWEKDAAVLQASAASFRLL